jgi:hypothetical protein
MARVACPATLGLQSVTGLGERPHPPERNSGATEFDIWSHVL